ncbi:MAG: winged helix-turn-helix domain-containing protein [Nitrososphaerota archaeon]|nr:winged helix-turn-helix domain-containing protein [Nitrososphaerota archaeon]
MKKSFADYAYELLFRAGQEGMHYRELTAQILKLKQTKGKTPDQTILSILERDKRRFEKVGKGTYRVKVPEAPPQGAPSESPQGIPASGAIESPQTTPAVK